MATHPAKEEQWQVARMIRADDIAGFNLATSKEEVTKAIMDNNEELDKQL